MQTETEHRSSPGPSPGPTDTQRTVGCDVQLSLVPTPRSRASALWTRARVTWDPCMPACVCVRRVLGCSPGPHANLICACHARGGSAEKGPRYVGVHASHVKHPEPLIVLIEITFGVCK